MQLKATVRRCRHAPGIEIAAAPRLINTRDLRPSGEFSTYTIGVIGFERAGCRELQRVVGLSEHRQPGFGPFNKVLGGYPHVVVVNADQPGALEKWNGFRRANAHRASFAPIFVSRQPTDLPCPRPYVLYRPILTTQLFSVLDQVVTEVHGYRPAAADVPALMVDDNLSARASTNAGNAVPDRLPSGLR